LGGRFAEETKLQNGKGKWRPGKKKHEEHILTERVTARTKKRGRTKCETAASGKSGISMKKRPGFPLKNRRTETVEEPKKRKMTQDQQTGEFERRPLGGGGKPFSEKAWEKLPRREAKNGAQVNAVLRRENGKGKF